MIELLCELELVLRQDKIIGLTDYLVIQINSDGSGLLLTRGLIRGIIKESKLLDFDTLNQFYLKVGEMLGKEVNFK